MRVLLSKEKWALLETPLPPIPMGIYVSLYPQPFYMGIVDGPQGVWLAWWLVENPSKKAQFRVSIVPPPLLHYIRSKKSVNPRGT